MSSVGTSRVHSELLHFGEQCGSLLEVPLPGPKGYTHGWVYVGGPGLPSKSDHLAALVTKAKANGVSVQAIGLAAKKEDFGALERMARQGSGGASKPTPKPRAAKKPVFKSKEHNALLKEKVVAARPDLESWMADNEDTRWLAYMAGVPIEHGSDHEGKSAAEIAAFKTPTEKPATAAERKKLLGKGKIPAGIEADSTVSEIKHRKTEIAALYTNLPTQDEMDENSARNGSSARNAGEHSMSTLYWGRDQGAWDYFHLNKALRAGTAEQHDWGPGGIEALDTLAKRDALETDATLYRMLSGPVFGKIKPGDIISDKAFMSTSDDLSSFTRDETGLVEKDTFGKYKMVINAPAGTHRFMGDPELNEHVLGRGQRMRVDKVGKRGISVTILPPE